ncbi:MAG TPA: VWA domain-containing protein [Actinomycetales bacterium]|nr:VWA domain-containing protein [Actinomycetales bacterium]
MTSPRWRHLALAVMALAALGAVTMSTAAAASTEGTLSGTTIKGDVVTTLLSLPPSTVGQVDRSTVTATVGGRDVDVEMVAVAARSRAVVLLVDTSGSMRSGGLEGAKRAARVLAQQLPADVRLGVVSFSDRPRVLVRPTTDRAVAERAIDGLVARGETSLYDGVIAAVKAAGTDGDRRLLLLSDGGDTVSGASLDQAVRSLGSVTLDAVAFRTDESQSSVLRSLASAGHGRVATASTSTALTGAFADTAAEIASQVQLRVRVPSGVTGSVPLVVTAAVGDGTVTARTVLQLLHGAAPVPGTVNAAGLRTHQIRTSVMVATPWPLIASAFAVVLVSVLLISAPLLEGTSKKRTRQLELYSLQGRRGTALPVAGPSTGLVVEAAQGLVQRTGKEASSALRLDRAGMALRPAEWLVLQVTIALGTGVVLALLGRSVWLLLLGIVLGLVVTEVYLRIKVRRRLRSFERQLPDVLNLVASSLTTGFSLHQSLDAVAQDATDPISTELFRALAETRIGADLTDALDRLAERMDSENMRWTTMAIRIQQQVGGNLAETLRTTSATLREREQLRRMVRGLSAEGRLSAYILIGMPIGIFCYMLLTNGDYISLLWTTFLGWVMLALAFVGMVVGSFWMSRVVRVEV